MPEDKTKLLIEQQRQEILSLKTELAARETRLNDLTSLLDKYQSVFSRQTHLISAFRNGFEDDVMTGQNHQIPSTYPRRRGIGISAEPEDTETIVTTELRRYAKPEDVRKLIKQAIIENDFLSHLAQEELRDIIDCMQPIASKAGDVLIAEGETGSMVYVLFDGRLEIWKNGTKIREINKCTVLGELAILYNCQRTATVKAATACRLWAIDRKCFQTILRKRHIQRRRNRAAFLKSLPIFKNLSEAMLSQVADQLGEVHYQSNEYVIRQGARGDNLFIITQGKVDVTIYETGSDGEIRTEMQPRFVRTLKRGEWFGEKALNGDHKRTANIIAAEPEGATCLTLDYESYKFLIGDLTSLERRYSDFKIRNDAEDIEHKEVARLKLEDVAVIGTLGVGGFGRVELVRVKGITRKNFALKKIKKCHVKKTHQEEHVLNERSILLEVSSSFIVKLWRTFRDAKYIYLLLEACMGGELWVLLRDQYFFTEHATHFYVACVVEALDYLHNLDIIYRDLKPENLMLDDKGYCKLTDFGFAKRIVDGAKTWTFCGTPEYMAPEIVLNKGHDCAVDFWSLGILIFELLSGLPPFDSPDPMRTYSYIMKGIDAIGFPPKVNRNAQNLIRKLCRDNPAERLGYGKGGIREVERHVWFEGFDWLGLQKRSLPAPYPRPLKSMDDMQYFDRCPEDKEVPIDDLSGWDSVF